MNIHNLTTYATAFVGRQAEVNELNELLADANCRLLTLLGIGGVGKTRLAIAVAEQQVSDLADGVWFVNLQPVSSADLV